MEAKALERIENLVLSASAKRIEGTDIPVAAIPAGISLQSLEPYQKQRVRFRGTLKTSSLKDFANHVTSRKADGAKGFVTVDNAMQLGCTVIFNIGDETNPGHCDDLAVLSLESTAAFTAVNEISNKKVEQKDMAEWLEDWSDFVTAKGPDGEVIQLTRAVSAIRKVTIEAMSKAEHQVGDMSASRSTMDEIAAKSTEILPTSLEFNCVPFEGLESRTVVLRVGILTGSGKPVFSLRWVRKGAQMEEIASEFKDILKAEIGGMATLIMGSFSAGK